MGGGKSPREAMKETISPLRESNYQIRVFFSSFRRTSGIFWDSVTPYSSLSYQEFPSFNQAVECFHFSWWERQEEFIQQKIKEKDERRTGFLRKGKRKN